MSIEPVNSEISVAATWNLVTVAEAKEHSRVLDSEQDTLVETYIEAAQRHIEHVTGLTIAEVTVQDTFQTFGRRLQLARGNVSSIVSVTYTDSDGDTTTVDSDSYHLAKSFGVAYLYPTDVWPTDLADTEYPTITVTYKAGWTSAALVPAELKQAAMIYAGYSFENREGLMEEPEQFRRLVTPHNTTEWVGVD